MKITEVLKEAVEPINVADLNLEQQLEEINKRMDAAYRGMGIVNRMPDSPKRTKHRSRIMSNLNVIRGMLSRVLKRQAQPDDTNRMRPESEKTVRINRPESKTTWLS